MNYPVIDLHCDLLAHLLNMPKVNPFDTSEIGCAFPMLKEGNVKLQVMAIFTATQKGSSEKALKQSEIFADLLKNHPKDCYLVNNVSTLNGIATSSKIGMIAAIENASGFCEEDEKLEDGFQRLEQIISNTQGLLYIGLTHHAENRFGGGNNSTTGLKKDGKELLRYLDGRKIAIDFSHTSDALANDILSYIKEHQLDLPILASHSNYRSIFKHARNLPDDLAQKIINLGGVIGVNFVRAFVNNDDSEALYSHINHGIKLGGKKAICFGADYFCTTHHPDRTRVPFYFEAHEDASKYPALIEEIGMQISKDFQASISYNNAQDFLQTIWG